jgi:hypothetical protein
MKTVILYRPVGQRELDLIAESGYIAFPARLPHQPIFYPVLNRDYAEQIARDWNTRDEQSGFVGYVTEFDVEAEYLSRFEPRKVGGANHLEYWIPGEELQEFNRHIQGRIRVTNLKRNAGNPEIHQLAAFTYEEGSWQFKIDKPERERRTKGRLYSALQLKRLAIC